MTKTTTADEASAAGSALVGRRYAKETPQQRSAAASKAARTPWEGLTLEERRKEVKRRMAGKRKPKRKGKKGKKHRRGQKKAA